MDDFRWTIQDLIRISARPLGSHCGCAAKDMADFAHRLYEFNLSHVYHFERSHYAELDKYCFESKIKDLFLVVHCAKGAEDISSLAVERDKIKADDVPKSIPVPASIVEFFESKAWRFSERNERQKQNILAIRYYATITTHRGIEVCFGKTPEQVKSQINNPDDKSIKITETFPDMDNEISAYLSVLKVVCLTPQVLL